MNNGWIDKENDPSRIPTYDEIIQEDEQDEEEIEKQEEFEQKHQEATAFRYLEAYVPPPSQTKCQIILMSLFNLGLIKNVKKLRERPYSYFVLLSTHVPNTRGSDQIISHPRTISDTVRRQESKRAKKREKRKEKKRKEKAQKEEELKRIKNLMKEQIQTQLKKIQEISGVNSRMPLPILSLQCSFFL